MARTSSRYEFRILKVLSFKPTKHLDSVMKTLGSDTDE
jgi:hypothetical protein